MQLTRTLTNGWPITVEVAEEMPGSPDVVWELITDWEHQDDWMLEATDFVVTSRHREGVGVIAEATIKIGGITTRDEVEVTGWEPGKRLAIEHRGWVSGRGELHLTPLKSTDGSARTHVFWIEELTPPLGMLGALGMTGFKPLMARIFKRDLRVLAGLVRARSARPA